MIVPILCVLSFAVTFWAGRKSLGKGLVSLLFFGYMFGIVRANLLSSLTYFVFDLSVVALYLSQFVVPSPQKAAPRPTVLNYWVLILVLWPVIVVFMPYQPVLVSLVGLRGIAFFIPMLILGTRLREKDLVEICYGLVALNVLAAAFAAGEYFLGVPRFFPRNAATLIIYASGDVAGKYFRIPSTFSNAHSYGSTMVYTLPFALGYWNRAKSRLARWLMLVTVVTALAGVLLSAARLTFLMASIAVAATFFTTRMTMGRRVLFVTGLAGLGLLALGNERLTRFKSLKDTDYVVDRVAGSVNRGFWEILAEHPMGNGLGGGGTSMPYFLEGEVRNPIGIENAYGVILAEQGVFGLLFWIGFIVWFLGHAPVAFAKGPWVHSRRVGWCIVSFSLCTGWIGNGLFSSIPATVLLLLIMGWSVTPQAPEAGIGQRMVTRYRQQPMPVPSIS